jgi:beta-lactamase class A
MAFYVWLAAEAPENWEAFIAEHGRQGRTYGQLLEAMIVNSEEDATETLVDLLSKQNLQDLWQGWGLKETQIDPRRTSATELSYLLEKLYLGRWLKPEHHAHLMNLLSTYTANDDTRIGLLRRRLPEGTTIYNKRGSLVDWPKVVGDSAIIELPGASYVFTLHGLGKEVASYEHLEETLDDAVQLFGDYLLNS